MTLPFALKLGGHCRVFFFFFFFPLYLAVLRGIQNLSYPTRDWTHTLCSGSMES